MVGGQLSRVRGVLKRAVREPLMQFLAIGAALFAASALIRGPQRGTTGATITISEGRVNQLIESYLLLAGRVPSKAELESLVDDYVTEEIDYREAVAMGLDADDTIVRRRMRQKLEFLVEDADASEEPSEAQLEHWLKTHTDQYHLPERRAIRQVLASSDKRGIGARTDAEGWLTTLTAGADPGKLGDGSMLPTALPLTTEEGTAALFGHDFARSVFTHEGRGWFGPMSSPFGEHLVVVMETERGRPAALAEVHDKVRSDWIEAKRDAARDAHQARMRRRYKIAIMWPEPYRDMAVMPDPTPRTKKAPEGVSE
jgi:hypothetical protein